MLCLVYKSFPRRAPFEKNHLNKVSSSELSFGITKTLGE